MSAELKLKALAGGSLSLQVDDTLTTDETFNVSDGGIESGIGYVKFPDGTMMQWGQGAAGSKSTGGSLTTFPIPFVGGAPFASAIGSGTSATANVTVSYYSVPTLTGVVFKTEHTASVTIRWNAIGRWK